jgi:multidrug efflux pump
VIVGGIIFSLILTLFVIPAMYSFLSRRRPQQPEDGEEVLRQVDAISVGA